MKKILLTAAVLTSAFFLSFRNKPEPPAAGTYHFVYVDNSRNSELASISSEMMDKVDKTIEAAGKDNSAITFYISNGQRPDITTNATSARKAMSRLTSGSSPLPATWEEKKMIDEHLSKDKNLANAREINLHLFVSEAFLKTDLLSSQSGVLLKFLPKGMGLFANCPEEKIHVYLYYPKKATGSYEASLRGMQDFGNARADFKSGIQYHFISL
ncbi:hypothetical protein [Flaviaesturariibacter amylovorans]|uniref:DUF4347 domain-containing protein n=1 Tax=Flaviaesturariibacter amylovorans TaxID=1084520 RepID=A0ABP8HRH0_9BACT